MEKHLPPVGFSLENWMLNYFLGGNFRGGGFDRDQYKLSEKKLKLSLNPLNNKAY